MPRNNEIFHNWLVGPDDVFQQIPSPARPSPPVNSNPACRVTLRCNDQRHCNRGYETVLHYTDILSPTRMELEFQNCYHNSECQGDSMILERVMLNQADITYQFIGPGQQIHQVHCHRCQLNQNESEHRFRPYQSSGATLLVCRDCERILRAEELIHGHNWVPSSYKLVTGSYEKRMPNTLFYGTELEINTPGDRVQHANEFKAWLDSSGMGRYFYFKHDGSISNGYEIVTHPMTMQGRSEYVNWRQVCDYLRSTGATSEESGECGLHIHASNASLSQRDIGKLKYFFFNNRMRLHKLSRRTGYRYCQIERYGVKSNKWKRGNDYPLYYTQRYPDTGDRYVSVNVHTGKPTVEFRIMRGTLDYERLNATFQFVDAVIHFVKTHSIVTQDTPYTWSVFANWIRQSSNYNHLDKYLTKEGLR